MKSGNTSKAGDGCRGPEESFLFLFTLGPTLESDCLEIGWERWERRFLLDRFGAFSTVRENPMA